MHTCIHAYRHRYIDACMHACMHAYLHTYIACVDLDNFPKRRTPNLTQKVLFFCAPNLSNTQVQVLATSGDWCIWGD